MKRILLFISLLVSTAALYTYNQHVYQEQDKEKEKPSDKDIILGHFASVVGNMFNIMQNPENPQNVGNGIVGIFSNIVGLAVHAIQDKLGPDATEEDIQEFIKNNLDEELQEALRKIIVTRAREVRKKLLEME